MCRISCVLFRSNRVQLRLSRSPIFSFVFLRGNTCWKGIYLVGSQPPGTLLGLRLLRRSRALLPDRMLFLDRSPSSVVRFVKKKSLHPSVFITFFEIFLLKDPSCWLRLVAFFLAFHVAPPWDVELPRWDEAVRHSFTILLLCWNGIMSWRPVLSHFISSHSN